MILTCAGEEDCEHLADFDCGGADDCMVKVMCDGGDCDWPDQAAVSTIGAPSVITTVFS